MILVEPTAQYKDSFIEAWREFDALPEATYTFGAKDQTSQTVETDFDAFLEREKRTKQGIGLTGTQVPQTHFWLIDDGVVIGEVSLRHRLNDKLRIHGGHIGYAIRPSKRRMGYGSAALRLTLSKAKELGINKILITCDTTNIASQKIIQANGGILQDIIPRPGHSDKMRWWISL